jgi:hypothetical protein
MGGGAGSPIVPAKIEPKTMGDEQGEARLTNSGGNIIVYFLH